MNKKRRGSLGEQMAIDFLQKKGYCVLQQNYRYNRGEIDIVARLNETLVFVEVKARSSLEFGDPIDAVTESKQRQIRKVAEGYLFVHEIEDTECRFDIISIKFINGKSEIEHVEDAF